MSLTLPETLLLFALHDDRGTVHSVAYIGLDHALRGALLAELKLRGHLQVRTSGEARLTPRPPGPVRIPLFDEALTVLRAARSPAPVNAWIDTLAVGLPNVRARVLTTLESRGILVPTGPSRRLADAATGSADVERRAREEVIAALRLRETIPPRLGMLVALTVAVHLDGVVFDSRRDEAEQLASWVTDRDSIVRAVTATIRRAEGEW
jgi:Golgi phosphoprotein 3 (GPP34)